MRKSFVFCKFMRVNALNFARTILIVVGLVTTSLLFVISSNSKIQFSQNIPEFTFSETGDAANYSGFVENSNEQLGAFTTEAAIASLEDHTVSPCPYDEPEKVRNRSLTRAVIAYFSASQLPVYLDQLKWCLRSLLEMMKTEPPLWRTDIVMYVEDVTISELLELGCSTEPRKNTLEPFRCVLVKYTRIHNRPLNIDVNSTDFKNTLQFQLVDYPYGDSLIPLAENPSVYADYEYVIRTDLDVFFTPAFAQWLPPHCSFITGSGGYSHEYNMEKLAHVANYSGIYFNSTVWNIGSTWIGTPSLVAKVAQRTVHWMVHLSKVEFAPKMRQADFWGKVIMWPEWHYGVLTMYGAHLAVNEVLQLGKKYPFAKMDLDHSTTSKANCSMDGPIHLHTYQNHEYFSKYVFSSRSYNETNPLPDVLHSTRCCDYAGYIAAQSLNISSVELGRLLREVKVSV